MWLFTTFGFFSVVAHASKPEDLLVRSRSLEDLDRLRQRLSMGASRLDIYETPNADYPYRLTAPREAVARVVADELLAMKATNFKHAVAQTDPWRARLYTQVWWDMKVGMNPEQLDLFGEADEAFEDVDDLVPEKLV